MIPFPNQAQLPYGFLYLWVSLFRLLNVPVCILEGLVRLNLGLTPSDSHRKLLPA